MEFDQRVAVDEVIESLGSPTETGHHLTRIDIFPCAVDTAALNQIDHPIREQLGVDAQLLAVHEAFCHRRWDCPATDLETVTIPDQRCDVGSELAFDVGDHGSRIFREWIVSLNDGMRAGERKTRRAIGLWHTTIDLRNDRAPHLASLLHKANIGTVATCAVRRGWSHRDHGDIQLPWPCREEV